MNSKAIWALFAAITVLAACPALAAAEDLVLEDIQISPLSTMIAGDPVSFEISISNTGDTASGIFHLVMHNGDGSDTTYALPALPSGAQMVKWHGKTYAAAGDYNLTASIVYSGTEESVDNNDKTISLEIVDGSEITNDFSLDEIRLMTPVVYGEATDFLITLSNAGIDAGNVALHIDYGNGIEETKMIDFGTDETKTVGASTTYSGEGDYYVKAMIDYGDDVMEFNEANNAATRKVTSILLAPGISLAYVSPTDSMTAGEEDEFTITISNTGSGTAYDAVARTVLDDFEDAFSYSAIAAGSSETLSFDVETDVCGTRTMTSAVGYEDAAGNPYSASISTTVHVTGSELELTDFYSSSGSVYRGEEITFTAKVENGGDYDAENVEVRIYRGSKLIETVDFGDMDAGDSKKKTVEWEAAGAADEYEFRAVVDADNDCSNRNDKDEEIDITIKESQSSAAADAAAGSSASTGTTGTTGYASYPSSVKSSWNGELIFAGAVIALEAIILALMIFYLVKRK